MLYHTYIRSYIISESSEDFEEDDSERSLRLSLFSFSSDLAGAVFLFVVVSSYSCHYYIAIICYRTSQALCGHCQSSE